MRAAKVILIGVTLAALMVPLAYAITFIGPINYVGAGGGNVTFAQNFQATRLSWVGGLSRFTELIWNGNNLGNIGFDAVGCNMTVTTMNYYILSYTVSAAGASTQRIYYRGLAAPQTTTGGTSTTVDGVTTVATVGATAVTLTWGSIAPEGVDIIQSVPGYIPLVTVMLIVFAAAIILMATRGELSVEVVVAFIGLAIGIILTTVILYQFIEAII